MEPLSNKNKTKKVEVDILFKDIVVPCLKSKLEMNLGLSTFINFRLKLNMEDWLSIEVIDCIRRNGYHNENAFKISTNQHRQFYNISFDNLKLRTRFIKNTGNDNNNNPLIKLTREIYNQNEVFPFNSFIYVIYPILLNDNLWDEFKIQYEDNGFHINGVTFNFANDLPGIIVMGWESDVDLENFIIS